MIFKRQLCLVIELLFQKRHIDLFYLKHKQKEKSF